MKPQAHIDRLASAVAARLAKTDDENEITALTHVLEVLAQNPWVDNSPMGQAMRALDAGYSTQHDPFLIMYSGHDD